MKKLLVTVIGATAAIGAFAGYPLQFDEIADGATSTNALNTAHGGDYWYANPEATDNAYTIEATTAVAPFNCPAPLGSTPDKALSIKTKFTNPLSANFVNGGATTNINDGLFFDSLVKFTVCDTAPEADSYDNAKIVMWLQEDEDLHTTNLWIRAGYLSYNGESVTSVSTNYITGKAIDGAFAETWHRVTIKAIADITDGTGVPGFAVYIDANQNVPTVSVTCGDPKWDNTFDFALTEDAAFLNKSGAVFPSMIQSGANKQTLEAVAFDGTGSISDLVFTDQAPAFAADFVEPKASITIGNLTTSYNTLEEAIDAVNEMSSGVNATFTLSKGMTISETLAFESAANVVFDFAGFVLTNNVAAMPAISNAGILTITNSNDSVGGIECTGLATTALSDSGDGQLTITAGNFKGHIILNEEGTYSFTGGAFLDDGDFDDYLSAIPAGKKLSQNQETDLWEIVDIVPVAQIEGGAQYETLAEAVAAAQAGQTVTVLKDCTVAEPITFNNGIVVSNDYTVTLSAAYALRFANGTASPVTFCGSGSFEQPSGVAGSPILVGNNEVKSSYSMPSTFEGSLVLNSGNITILHAKNNVIKVEKGSFVMNGGNLSGGKCGVKADSEHGDATTTVTINGGVVSNLTAAVATVVAGSGSATVTIAGGEITGPFSKGDNTTLTIPGTSTAKFDAEHDQTAYCEAGYKTVLSDGWYVVTAKEYYTAISLNKATTSLVTNETETLTATLTPASAADDSVTWTTSDATVATVEGGLVTAVAAGTAIITAATENYSATCTVTVTAPEPTPADPTIDPETNTPVPVEAETAEAAKEAVKITPPATSGADAAAYKALFNLKAESAGEGKFNVSIDSIKDSVEQSVAVSAEELVSGSDATGTITIPAGLYYKVTPSAGLPISGTPVKGLSDGTTTTITKPTGTQGFIKVEIGTAEYK